jgi:hypothetical protein
MAVASRSHEKSPYETRISNALQEDNELSSIKLSNQEYAVMLAVWSNQRSGRLSEIKDLSEKIKDKDMDGIDVEKTVQALIGRKMLTSTIVKTKVDDETKFVNSITIPNYMETSMEILWKRVSNFDSVMAELSQKAAYLKEHATARHNEIKGVAIGEPESAQALLATQQTQIGEKLYNAAEIRQQIKAICSSTRIGDNLRDVAILMLSLYDGPYNGLSRKSMAVGFIYAASQEIGAGYTINYLSKYVRLANKTLEKQKKANKVEDRQETLDFIKELKVMTVARAYKRIVDNIGLEYVHPNGVEHLIRRYNTSDKAET